VLDIDHYKKLNDAFGHAAGDYVLRVFGETLRTALHTSGWAFRYGGDEFVLLLPHMGKEATLQWVEQFQAQVSALSLRHDGKILEMITLSVGVAVSPDDGITLETLINAADNALYVAKRDGRNCVRLANAVGAPINAISQEVSL
jgi:diguanylate cyclase (GGDEF)-like protein